MVSCSAYWISQCMGSNLLQTPNIYNHRCSSCWYSYLYSSIHTCSSLLFFLYAGLACDPDTGEVIPCTPGYVRQATKVYRSVLFLNIECTSRRCSINWKFFYSTSVSIHTIFYILSYKTLQRNYCQGYQCQDNRNRNRKNISNSTWACKLSR